MTIYYKAIFPDGSILTRSTASRTYSHGWLAKGYHGPLNEQWPAGNWQSDGFSGSEELARKALKAADRFDPRYTTNFRGTAPAVEITAAEYRALKQEARQ